MYRDSTFIQTVSDTSNRCKFWTFSGNGVSGADIASGSKLFAQRTLVGGVWRMQLQPLRSLAVRQQKNPKCSWHGAKVSGMSLKPLALERIQFFPHSECRKQRKPRKILWNTLDTTAISYLKLPQKPVTMACFMSKNRL